MAEDQRIRRVTSRVWSRGSCSDQIFALRNTAEKCIEWNTALLNFGRLSIVSIEILPGT